MESSAPATKRSASGAGVGASELYRGQGLTKLVVIPEPLPGLFLQATEHHRRQTLRQLRAKFPGRGRRLLQGVGQQLDHVLALEGRLAGQQIKQGHAHGIHVRAHVEVLPAELLRRAKRRRAQERPLQSEIGVAAPRGGYGEAKIANLDRAVGIFEAVGRFDVAVQDADGLRGFEAGDHLQDGIDGFAHGQRAMALDALLQGAPRDQFHGDSRGAADLLRAVNVNAVRMIDRGGQASFAQEPAPGLRGIKLVSQHLERNAAPALQVLGLIDRAHAPAAQFAHDAVAAEGIPRFGQLAAGQGCLRCNLGWAWLRLAGQGRFGKTGRADAFRRIAWQRLATFRADLIRIHKCRHHARCPTSYRR